MELVTRAHQENKTKAYLALCALLDAIKSFAVATEELEQQEAAR
jgi:hypothetical protein